MMDNKKAIDRILESKIKLTSESEELQIQRRENGGRWKSGHKERYTQIMSIQKEYNIELIKLGYRKSAKEVSEIQSLCVLLRMKDIIRENFGHEKAELMEKEAHRRHETGDESKTFQLLSDKDLKILESHKTWERDQSRYHVLIRQIRDLKSFLESKIQSESDYSKRQVYSEIFKML